MACAAAQTHVLATLLLYPMRDCRRVDNHATIIEALNPAKNSPSGPAGIECPV